MLARPYLRASTDEQDASRAHAQIEAFAAERGLTIAGTYVETESGAKLARSELFRLIADSRPGDVLLIEQVDRLSRLTDGDWRKLRAALDTKQVRVVALDLPTSWMLANTGDDFIRAEKQSGTSTEGRAELKTVLDFLRPGDELVVTRIDRLARSIGDLQDIVRAIRAKGASLKATEQPIDTSTAAGKAFLDMLGVFAEFETNLRKERQLEGIAAAKAAGVYKGRPAKIDATKVNALKAEGLGATEIAKRLGVGRASVYRLMGVV